MRTGPSSTVRATETTRCQHLKGIRSRGDMALDGIVLQDMVPGEYGPTLSLDRMTDGCENITFLQLRWQAVTSKNKHFVLQ